MSKVLIADDAALVRSRIASRLRLLPGVHDVLESGDFPSTLAAIAEQRPELIVLDMYLPGGTGMEILHHLRSIGSPARVVIHTAWPDDTLHRRSLEAGACGFFEKGSGSLDAIDAIGALIREQQPEQTAPVVAALPLPAPPTPAVEPSEGSPPAAGLTVLIVEDHDFQRRTLARLLHRLGAAHVLEAADGHEAFERLATPYRSVQLIVCDLDMPNMDGMEFMRRFSQVASTAALVITSAQELSVLNSVETMCRAYGVQPLGIIEKPVTLGVLTGLLERLAHADPRAAAPAQAPDSPFDLQAILDGIDAGHFEAFYQPKAELSSGRIVGGEALARWRHPDKGLLAPFHFIELLETSGQIDRLTLLMIEAAARACRHWHDIGLRLGVSVNLSLASLGDTSLAGRLIHIVRQCGLDPRHVTLEVTETAAMTRIAPALENLARLRMHGFGLSIDDFGTGFASMEQLSRIAFTELKIDRRFVSTMTSRREAGAIVASSIDIGRRLGIMTIAEGVETPCQWEALKAAGCVQAQGYLIARPLDDAQFVTLCLERSR